MQETEAENINKKQNLHIALWLLKDTCWVLSFKWLGLFMILPTLSVAVYLIYKTRHSKADFYHNLAICSWIIGNSTWMVGDFLFNDTFRPYATVFFILGLLFVAYYYLILKPKNNGIT